MIPIDAIKVGNTLGEGVLWDVETQSLWWTDIEERSLYRYDWNRRILDRHATPERLGSFGFIQGSGRLIAAFESGFSFFDPSSGATDWLARPEVGRPGLRFNDGRVDRQGRFWAGSMAESEAAAGQGSLYRLDGNGRVSRQETGITISNSICWSPDGSVFYFADTPRRTIWHYACDAGGAISNRRVFAETPPGAFPDGATVDAEGFIWCAHWGAGQVVRYAPDGRIDRRLEVPARQPSCVALGGPDLDLLFVTSARIDLNDAAPGDGDVFITQAGVRGLPENRFRPD